MLQGKKEPREIDPHEGECNCPDQTLPLGLDTVVEDFLRRTRRILVVGEIDDIAAAHICSYLQVFSITKEPIYMYINSPGGSLYAGYAIIDQMLACLGPVVTIVRGTAHSMGAIIAAYGTKGHRYATPNSSLMLHSITIHNPATCLEQHKKMFDYTQLDYDKKVAALAKKIGTTKKKLDVIMSGTTWMQAKQAIKIGLIDGIWTAKKERAVTRSFMR